MVYLPRVIRNLESKTKYPIVNSKRNFRFLRRTDLPQKCISLFIGTRLECSSSVFACMLSESLVVIGFMLESRMLSWKFLIKFFQLHSDLSKLNGNFPTSKFPSKKFQTNFSKYIISTGYIDVGDRCWRQNVMVTILRC